MAGGVVEPVDLALPVGAVRIDGEGSSDHGDGGPKGSDPGHVDLANRRWFGAEHDPEVPRRIIGAVQQLPASERTLAAGVGEVETWATGPEASPIGCREVFPRLHRA